MSRVVLITGGNRGIGLACAKAFLESGDKVAITYRSKPPVELEGNESVLALPCDVTSGSDVDEAFTRIEQHWGPVEVLVANAGITQDTLLMRMNEQQWDDVIDTNLKGAWRCAQRASKAMIKARSGRIIFISSIVGVLGSPGQTNYAASKSGMIGLARSITRELGAREITANVVAPGPIATDMLSELGDEGSQRLIDLVPAGRAGKPEEVAAAVGFLASPLAGYISGVVLPVDGGAAMGT